MIFWETSFVSACHPCILHFFFFNVAWCQRFHYSFITVWYRFVAFHLYLWTVVQFILKLPRKMLHQRILKPPEIKCQNVKMRNGIDVHSLDFSTPEENQICSKGFEERSGSVFFFYLNKSKITCNKPSIFQSFYFQQRHVTITRRQACNTRWKTARLLPEVVSEHRRRLILLRRRKVKQTRGTAGGGEPEENFLKSRSGRGQTTAERRTKPLECSFARLNLLALSFS